MEAIIVKLTHGSNTKLREQTFTQVLEMIRQETTRVVARIAKFVHK